MRVDATVRIEFEGKLEVSVHPPLPPPPPLLYLLHMVFDMVPKKKKNLVWAEEKPSILSGLKFDSEVQDPGRQKSKRRGREERQRRSEGFFFFCFNCEERKLTK